MENQEQSFSKEGNLLSIASLGDNQFVIEQNQGQRVIIPQQMLDDKAIQGSNTVRNERDEKQSSKIADIFRQKSEQKKQTGSEDDRKMDKSSQISPKTKRQGYKEDPKLRTKETIQFNTQKTSLKVSKEILNVSFLSKNEMKQSKKQMNPFELEEKIKEIARQIRKKVKRDHPKSKKSLVIEAKTQRKVNNKDVLLAPLSHNFMKNDFSLTSPTGISRISPNNPGSIGPQQLETKIMPETIVRAILKKDIFQKVMNQIEEKQKNSRLRLKLDPLKHHYPVTTFRKAVLQEQKSLHLKDLEKQKEKEKMLMKRKQIFNNSRYQRYADMLSKNQKNEMVSSNVFSIDLNGDNPEQDNLQERTAAPQKGYEERIIQESKKTPEIQGNLIKSQPQVSSEIAEIDSLIKKMIQSNQNPGKEEALESI